jgi:hypothetical protein
MRTRRAVLVLGLGGLLVSAMSRVAVAGPVQVDTEAYAGSSAGQWTCGPTARANYGGVGGHVRVYTDDQPAPARPEDTPNGGAMQADVDGAPPVEQVESQAEQVEHEPEGFSIGAGGGGEYRAYTRLACNDELCTPPGNVVPPARLLGAGEANLGYDLRYFGVRLGALAFQRWEHNTDGSPTAVVLPTVDLRFARRVGFHAGLGFGAYNVSTISRPGAYLGVGYASGAWAADLRAGAHLTFDDQAGLRADASVRYGLSRVVAPGLGLAVSSAERVSPEGRLFVVFTP